MTDAESVAAATARSIAAARDDLGPLDEGAVAVLEEIAARIDAVREGGRFDNVLIPTYLKFAESLGLTPGGRVKLGAKDKPPAGKLAAIRADVRRAS